MRNLFLELADETRCSVPSTQAKGQSASEPEHTHDHGKENTHVVFSHTKLAERNDESKYPYRIFCQSAQHVRGSKTHGLCSGYNSPGKTFRDYGSNYKHQGCYDNPRQESEYVIAKEGSNIIKANQIER